MALRLAPADLAVIRDDAARAYPNECCGLLTGRDQGTAVVVTGVHPSPNVTDGDPRLGFEVDPRLRFDLMRATEDATDGTRIVGHYHSHPDGPAEPSARDLEQAHEPDLIWVICRATESGAGAVDAFRLDPDRRGFTRLDLIVA